LTRDFAHMVRYEPWKQAQRDRSGTGRTTTIAALRPKSAVLAYEHVAEQLRKSIVDGKLRVDNRLPSEEALGDRFGVSRSTVREALRSLSSQGFLRTTRGVYGGSSVRRFGHSDATLAVGNAIAMLSNAREITVDEILQARELFEIPACRLAATERTTEQLAQLRSFIPARGVRLSLAETYRMNIAFHNATLDATGNRLLRTMVRPLFDILPRRFARELAAVGFWRHVAADHRSILRAIENRDSDEAARLMGLHLARVRPTYLTIDRRTVRRR
jgi:GntR family transcriptional regulator, transcriptional repressor for pyruvate dehydrogenase complex